MRYMTHSHRVVYRAPIFLTMSPDETQSAVMLKLSLLRRCGPAHAGDAQSQRWGERSQPSLDVEYMSLSIDEVKTLLPEYDDRRGIVARDPLAAPDEFHAACEVILETLVDGRLVGNVACLSCCFVSHVTKFGGSLIGGLLVEIKQVLGRKLKPLAHPWQVLLPIAPASVP